MLVMKFGGTSLGDRARIDTVVDLVRGRLDRSPIVVCSAHAGVTDLLLDGAHAAAGGDACCELIRDREHTLLRSLGLDAALVDDDLERGQPPPHYPRYDEIAGLMGCFRQETCDQLQQKPLQQLWRDHLLVKDDVLHVGSIFGECINNYIA